MSNQLERVLLEATHEVLVCPWPNAWAPVTRAQRNETQRYERLLTPEEQRAKNSAIQKAHVGRRKNFECVSILCKRRVDRDELAFCRTCEPSGKTLRDPGDCFR